MRRLLGLITATAFVGGSIALATPAGAAQVGSITVANGTPSGNQVCDNNQGVGSYNVTNSGGATQFGNYTFTGTSSDVVLVTNNCQNAGSDIAGQLWVIQNSVPTQVPNNGGTINVSLSAGNFGLYTLNSGGSLVSSYYVQVSGGGGGTPSGGESSLAPAPVLETLTLQVSTSDTTCTGGSPTGYTGSWLQLPAADACSQSGPDANPNARLLGWATDPIFPVSVAKEIVDLKYGPIDGYFYGMRMIFIPAGGWTYVSSSNNLYPIWSS